MEFKYSIRCYLRIISDICLGMSARSNRLVAKRSGNLLSGLALSSICTQLYPK